MKSHPLDSRGKSWSFTKESTVQWHWTTSTNRPQAFIGNQERRGRLHRSPLKQVCISVFGVKLWNSLDNRIKCCLNIMQFEWIHKEKNSETLYFIIFFIRIIIIYLNVYCLIFLWSVNRTKCHLYKQYCMLSLWKGPYMFFFLLFLLCSRNVFKYFR